MQHVVSINPTYCKIRFLPCAEALRSSFVCMDVIWHWNVCSSVSRKKLQKNACVFQPTVYRSVRNFKCTYFSWRKVFGVYIQTMRLCTSSLRFLRMDDKVISNKLMIRITCLFESVVAQDLRPMGFLRPRARSGPEVRGPQSDGTGRC